MEFLADIERPTKIIAALFLTRFRLCFWPENWSGFNRIAQNFCAWRQLPTFWTLFNGFHPFLSFLKPDSKRFSETGSS